MENISCIRIGEQRSMPRTQSQRSSTSFRIRRFCFGYSLPLSIHTSTRLARGHHRWSAYDVMAAGKTSSESIWRRQIVRFIFSSHGGARSKCWGPVDSSAFGRWSVAATDPPIRQIDSSRSQSVPLRDSLFTNFT